MLEGGRERQRAGPDRHRRPGSANELTTCGVMQIIFFSALPLSGSTSCLPPLILSYPAGHDKIKISHRCEAAAPRPPCPAAAGSSSAPSSPMVDGAPLRVVAHKAKVPVLPPGQLAKLRSASAASAWYPLLTCSGLSAQTWHVLCGHQDWRRRRGGGEAPTWRTG